MSDLTERTRAQQALSQTLDELAHISRITTLGEFAASIAHELNQPLVAIIIQLQQVAINLMINAAQAMETMESGQRQLVVSIIEPGAGLAGFELSDTGPGIMLDARSLCFLRQAVRHRRLRGDAAARHRPRSRGTLSAACGLVYCREPSVSHRTAPGIRAYESI